MRLSLTLLAFLFVAAIPSVVHASTISFTESATASGTLNGVSFSSASFSITGSYDTTQITSPASGIFSAPTKLTFTIGGLGSVTSSGTSDYIFINQNAPLAGVGDLSYQNQILSTSNSAYATLTLANPFGPIVSLPYYVGSDTTSGGLLALNTSSMVTFTTQNASPTVTPEPSSLLLLATGLTGIAGIARRRLR